MELMKMIGSTDVTLPVLLRDALTGEPKTGVTVTNLDVRWIRVETDNDVTYEAAHNLTALTALTDDHTDYGAYEIGQGEYRIDLPDAIFASGATLAKVVIWDAAANTVLAEHIVIALDGVDVQAVNGSQEAADSLEIAAARIANKKDWDSSGVEQVYDAAGTTVLKVFTPSTGGGYDILTPSDPA